MNGTQIVAGRVGRWSLWLLLALAIPYAALVFYSGLIWGVPVVGAPLNKFFWFVAVGLPIWVWLAMLGIRAYPRHPIQIALIPWLIFAGLVAWALIDGVVAMERAQTPKEIFL